LKLDIFDGEEYLDLMKKTIAVEEKAFGGPTCHFEDKHPHLNAKSLCEKGDAMFILGFLV
jgi:hypothetical protein